MHPAGMSGTAGGGLSRSILWPDLTETMPLRFLASQLVVGVAWIAAILCGAKAQRRTATLLWTHIRRGSAALGRLHGRGAARLNRN